MKKKINASLLILLSTVVLWTGCKEDDDPVTTPQPPTNDDEVITTMSLMFLDSSDFTNFRNFTYRDPDGDGGLVPDIFDTISLDQNKTWLAYIFLFNETANPIDTVSLEVLEEAEDHLFCFTPGGTSASVVIMDMDDNGLPIGMESKWYTTAAGNGTMKIELKHQPGVKNGSCNLGNSDINVNFQVRVQ